MDFSKLTILKTDYLILRQISDADSTFISELFHDNEIRKYYIVPKEAQQDYKRLVSYWKADFYNGAGNAWVIYAERDSNISPNNPCGFFAFEFRKSLKNVRISYALRAEFRKKGIITKCIELVSYELSKLGVETMEADIDIENLESTKLIEKLGFSTDTRSALVDPEMMRDGEIRFRYLWHKDIFDYSKLDFHAIRGDNLLQLFNNRTIFKIWAEEVSDNGGISMFSSLHRMRTTGKFHFLFQADVTEGLVGISADTKNIYNVPWELLREDTTNNKAFLIFCGWGDQMSGGHLQFNYYEIGIEKEVMANLLESLITSNPRFYAIDKMRNVIGLEKFRFDETGQVSI